jgi:predicted nucleic acid-binding protein
MKHTLLLCCAFFASISLQCSEQEKQLELIKKIDYKKIEKTLSDDYFTYAREELENYKNTEYTPQKMGHVSNMNRVITGNQYASLPYNEIRDEQGNSFIRVAVAKMDQPIVDYFVLRLGTHCITPEDFDYCLNLCAEKLNPKNNITATEKSTAYNILKILSAKQGSSYYTFLLNQKSSRESLLNKLIRLQLKHKKHQSPVTIEQEFIEQHLTAGKDDQSPILLPDLYQTIANKKGNTLSHIMVQLQNPTELCELINKNYASPATNKAGETVLDLALHHFQTFTQDPSSFDLHPEAAAQARCCLFMLLRYIKSKQNDQLSNEYICCDKHVITI